MMNYTKETYDILAKYDSVLFTATYADYVRTPERKDLEILNNIYMEKTGDTKGFLNGCNRCLLRGLRTIGKLYFQDKQLYEQLAKKEEEAYYQQVTEVIENKATKKSKKNGKEKA